MIPCDWLLPGMGIEQTYPANAFAVLVRWFTQDSLVTPQPPLDLNGVRVARPDSGLYHYGEPAVAIIRLVQGHNLISAGKCSWDIVPSGKEDHSAPAWLSPPVAGQRDEFVAHWSTQLSEVAYLVVWRFNGLYPIWVIPAPSDPEALKFGFWVGGPRSHLFPGPDIVLASRPVVLRPLDSSGNFGDAWKVDPLAGTAERLDDASPYRWTELESWIAAAPPATLPERPQSP